MSLLILAIVCIFAMCTSPLIAANDQFALLVQKSPEYGGVVTPSESVQMTGVDQFVTVSATARDGYVFVYWLGDVVDPTNSTTMVLVDSPKMVIAVFQRPGKVASAKSFPSGFAKGSKGYSGGSFTSSTPRSNPLASSAPVSMTSYSFSDTPNQFDFSDLFRQLTFNVLDPSEDPVDPEDPEVPEPATILMLGAGAMMLLRKRK